ncbi:MAG: HesA/MoeB/ThiF family protein [Planctomycetes bacterium]|nr:HesA/MoeB/ThiF family protein [Planctomycetota bacterium]
MKLTDKEKAVYDWQMSVPGFGEGGQEKLKDSSVLVSRCGGLGSVVCLELAAAGVGKLICAHGGNVKESDLNRQLLMTDDWLGKPRIETIKKRLLDLNPRLEIVAVGENINEKNVESLVEQADLVVDAAPLFEERFLMNRECVKQNKVLVECAMHELKAHITSIKPGDTPCLSCIYPVTPSAWTRKFPVFGAVSGTVACMGAMESIKILSGLGDPLYGSMLTMDLRTMNFRKIAIKPRANCPICQHIQS